MARCFSFLFVLISLNAFAQSMQAEDFYGLTIETRDFDSWAPIKKIEVIIIRDDQEKHVYLSDSLGLINLDTKDTFYP